MFASVPTSKLLLNLYGFDDCDAVGSCFHAWIAGWLQNDLTLTLIWFDLGSLAANFSVRFVRQTDRTNESKKICSHQNRTNESQPNEIQLEKTISTIATSISDSFNHKVRRTSNHRLLVSYTE